MKYYYFVSIISFLILSSCGVVKEKHGLTKLSFKESLRRNLEGIPPSSKVVFVNKEWDTLSTIELDSIFLRDDFTLDEYINEEEIVEAFVVRKSTKRDLRRRKRLLNALEAQRAFEELQSATLVITEAEVPSIDIDCSRIDPLLSDIFLKDQSMRKDSIKINDSIDQANQHYVINIIEKCNFPDSQNFSKHGALTVWLVIQHGSKNQRKKYFEKFALAKELGLITGGNLATMEDRILLENNLPQKYGTQLHIPYPGRYEIRGELRSLDSVDIYRKSVGLEPLSEYLEKLNKKK